MTASHLILGDVDTSFNINIVDLLPNQGQRSQTGCLLLGVEVMSPSTIVLNIIYLETAIIMNIHLYIYLEEEHHSICLDQQMYDHEPVMKTILLSKLYSVKCLVLLMRCKCTLTYVD